MNCAHCDAGFNRFEGLERADGNLWHGTEIPCTAGGMEVPVRTRSGDGYKYTWMPLAEAVRLAHIEEARSIHANRQERTHEYFRGMNAK